MRTIACDYEAAPWSNNLMGTRLLFPSDDSDNFSGVPHRTRTEIMINQATFSLPGTA
jgi:hypothetical protein